MDTRVALEAWVNGRTFSTQLYDLSPTGCRFDCPTSSLSSGDRIVFKFNDQTKVAGKIAWRHRDTAGVQFSSRLPDAIARHLPSRRTSAPGEYQPTDWFLR